jgi:cytochrome c nitrite reductase small subunit
VTRSSAYALVAALIIGVAAGLGLFTFGYAKGYSYLGHDPQACANCHVMSEHFAAWTKGSHHAVATCNDCHTPHALIPKYAVKARNGFWHSFYFTVGGYPDPLRITEGNRRVTENACRYCHTEITEAIDHVASRDVPPVRLAAQGIPVAPSSPLHDPGSAGAEPISCIRCHRYVGHWVR